MELEPCVKKDEGIASTIPRYCYKKNNHWDIFWTIN
jgi:hypothetical protein